MYSRSMKSSSDPLVTVFQNYLVRGDLSLLPRTAWTNYPVEFSFDAPVGAQHSRAYLNGKLCVNLPVFGVSAFGVIVHWSYQLLTRAH